MVKVKSHEMRLARDFINVVKYYPHLPKDTTGSVVKVKSHEMRLARDFIHIVKHYPHLLKDTTGNA